MNELQIVLEKNLQMIFVNSLNFLRFFYISQVKSNINTVLVLVAIALGVIALAKISNLRSENDQLKNSLQNKNVEESVDHVELAVYMSAIQNHFSKLYFASKANNLPLAKFYAHEINESFELIVDADLVDDGHNISALANLFGKEPFKRFEKSLNENGLVNFDDAYSNLINNCNSCHLSTDHAFVNIVIPERHPVGNQNYTFTGQ